MTKTQLSILRLKRGQPVGFKTRSGLVKPLGYMKTLSKQLQAKVKKK